MKKTDILIIGVGNVLMQDEGIGVRAVEKLECQYIIPPNIKVIDGGTSGTELLNPMRGAKHLIIADAINSGKAPGTLFRMVDDDIPAFFQTKLSNHQLGISDLLALLKLTDEMPQHISIIGMEPYKLKNKLGLSDKASQALPKMVSMLVDELKLLGISLKQRKIVESGFWETQAKLEQKKCA